MPKKLYMDLNTANHNARLIAKYQASLAALKQAPKAPAGLNSSMVGRIHSIKPGCGSCGK